MNVARNFLSPQRQAMAVRHALAGVSLVALAALSACGGGGSAGLVDDPIVINPPPPPPATQTCPDGSVIPVTSVCPSPPPPPPPATQTCPDGSVIPVTSVCPPPPLRYSVILATTGGTAGVPTVISGESCATVKVELMENATSFPEQPEWNFALFGARVYEQVSSLGWIKVAAQVVADENKFRGFLFNPVTNKLVDNDGSQGDMPSVSPLDEGWKRVSESNHPDPDIGKWAQSDKLFVYVRRENGNVPYCEDVVAGERAGADKRVILPITEEMETFGGFWHFKN